MKFYTKSNRHRKYVDLQLDQLVIVCKMYIFKKSTLHYISVLPEMSSDIYLLLFEGEFMHKMTMWMPWTIFIALCAVLAYILSSVVGFQALLHSIRSTVLHFIKYSKFQIIRVIY